MYSDGDLLQGVLYGLAQKLIAREVPTFLVLEETFPLVVFIPAMHSLAQHLFTFAFIHMIHPVLDT